VDGEESRVGKRGGRRRAEKTRRSVPLYNPWEAHTGKSREDRENASRPEKRGRSDWEGEERDRMRKGVDVRASPHSFLGLERSIKEKKYAESQGKTVQKAKGEGTTVKRTPLGEWVTKSKERKAKKWIERRDKK